MAAIGVVVSDWLRSSRRKELLDVMWNIAVLTLLCDIFYRAPGSTMKTEKMEKRFLKRSKRAGTKRRRGHRFSAESNEWF
jgi:hypothetical protein